MSESFLPENTKRALELLSKKVDVFNNYKFYLAGGTALAFDLKYRVSYDLDFFSQKEFDTQKLLSNLSDLDLKNIREEKNTLKFEFNKTEISFFYYPYKLLEQTTPVPNTSIEKASILDIVLMKITAISGRGLEKDFADVYFGSKKIGGLIHILDKFKEKFPQSNFEHYLKSLVYFEDATNGPNLNILIDNYNFEEIKQYFLTEINSFYQKQLTSNL